MNINGVVAVVTGGSSGMGAETVRMLAEEGAKIAIFDLNEQAGNELAAKVGGLYLKCDVTSSDSVENAFREVAQQLDAPRVCINCAGVATPGKVVGRDGPLDLSAFKKVIDINLIGTFNVLRIAAFFQSQLAPMNDDSEHGVIINTASIAAYEGQIGQAAYSASKAGIVGMTLPIARELARFGIRVVTIAPGLIDTPMMAGMTETVKASLLETTVFPKRLGHASEFAKLVCHVIDNPLINGEVIRLDGAVRLAIK